MMLHKRILLSWLVCAAAGLTMPSLLLAQAKHPCKASAWTLPCDTSVHNTGPRTYRFTVVYNTADSTGKIVRRQRVVGDYTLGLPHDAVEWNHVTVANAEGATGPFAAAEKRTFMDGFRYREHANSLAPDFFKSFPASAVMERDLVWDTEMFETFGQGFLGQLKLNQPLPILAGQELKMYNVGTFKNQNVVLEWVGRSRRNGQDCALIDYRAFFNPLHIANAGVTLDGRSDYWGEIWVSLATRQIEYATLYEEVTGEMKLPNQSGPQSLSIFRIGTFAPVRTSH